MLLVWILVSTLIASAISLIGVITLAIKKSALECILFGLIGFSAGALIGGFSLYF